MTTYKSVTRARPCPVCGRDHKCAIGADGSVQCGRVQGGLRKGDRHNGHVFLGLCEGDPQFGVFRAEDDPVLQERKKERRRDSQQRRRADRDGAPQGVTNGSCPDSGMEAKARALAAKLTAEHAEELARELGLPESALWLLPGIGYSPTGFHKEHNGKPCWTFPEVISAGKVTGLVCRYPDGSKLSMPGSVRGVYVPVGWLEREGPVFIPEGASDTLTLTALGLSALGRPNNRAGVDQLRELLREVPADRPIIVVGEYDAKPDGTWPGRDGMIDTATALASALGRPVGWALPPDRAKDIRKWALDQRPDPAVADEWSEPGDRLLAALVGAMKIVEPASKNAAAGPSKLYEIDAADLLERDDPKALEHLPLLGKDGYLVRGWSHVVAGFPRCGKTELILACIKEWLRLGLRVLYFTEEAEPLWRERLSRHEGPWRGLQLVFGLAVPAPDLLARMAASDQEVVVVDTLRNLGILGADENDNAAVARAVAPWVSEARRTGKTWFGLHHTRKGGGDHGQGISGAHALLGSVDIALEIAWDNNPKRRLVKGHARIVQIDDLLYEQDQDGGLRALGDPSGVTVIEVRARLLQALGADWLKSAEVLGLLDAPRPSEELLRQALQAEAKAGRVERDPPITDGAVRGKTVRWRAAGR
jgi:hypothetical protein